MSSGLIPTIKEAAMAAVNNSQPAMLTYGTVESEKPLKIKIDDKTTLTEEFLVVPIRLTEHVIEMTVEHFTEEDAFMNGAHTHTCPEGGTDSGNLDVTHKHEYKGRKKWLWHNQLLTGQKVIMIRNQGGQMYYVLDRIEE